MYITYAMYAVLGGRAVLMIRAEDFLDIDLFALLDFIMYGRFVLVK